MNDDLRALFPVTKHAVYLNHAAVSPPPIPTIEATAAHLRDVSENGSSNYRAWLATRERARQLLATMLGARPEQVAFTPNTSDGLSTVANGVTWNAGDNIITFRNEFPSNIYPWLRLRSVNGVEVRLCEERNGRIDLDELAGMIDQHTRLVAISYVQYASGFRSDLERLARAARKHDALFVVDVIQALGVMNTDVDAQMIDVAAGAGHKWLITPEGVGFLYLSDRARDRIQPTLVGWTSVKNPEDYLNFDQPWKEGSLSWETGTVPTALIHAFEASLELLLRTGVIEIEKYLEQLTDYLCDKLTDRDYEVVSSRASGEKSQIVCIRHTCGRNAMQLFHLLKQQNIITAPRLDRLRIAPHFYNTERDIDALIDALP